MICKSCGLTYQPLATGACPSCGGPLRLSAEDILGDRETRIVKEVRPAQIELAKSIEASVAANKHIVSEAGTGTGKSLALIVPPILAGKRVLISTATTLLQRQYVTQDLPFLLAHLGEMGHPFTFAVAKGRGHYLCRKRLHAYVERTKKDGKRTVSKRFLEWAQQTETGDKLELGRNVPKFWPLVNGEECVASVKCDFRNKCGLAAARAAVSGATVVVANHALVGIHMRYGHRLLPSYDYYIIDEAHQAANYYRNAFATRFSERMIPKVIRALEETSALPPEDQYDALVKDMRKTNEALFAHFPTLHDASFRMLTGTEIADEVDDLLYQLSSIVDMYGAEAKKRSVWKKASDSEYAAAAKDISKRTATLAEGHAYLAELSDEVVIRVSRHLQRTDAALRSIQQAAADMAETQEARILYIQFPRTQQQSREIIYSPVFVNRILRDNLFPVSPVAATSATLTVNGEFKHFCEEMGFDEDCLTYVTDSPFDYEHRSILYCSRNVPIHPARAKVPRDQMERKLEEYYDVMTDEIVSLTDASGGYAFVLFTSRVEMEAVGTRLEKESEFPVRTQDENSTTGDLEEWFRQTDHPILCGLKSFWEGVSIEGDQLRLVAITKAPFPMQGDPVYQAKKDILEKQHRSWFKRFQKLDIPAMITDVKQGTGRLIRTKLDFGVAAILDRKVTDQANKRGSYASLLINSLPFTRITANLGDVKKFLRQFEQGSR